MVFILDNNLNYHLVASRLGTQYHCGPFDPFAQSRRHGGCDIARIYDMIKADKTDIGANLTNIGNQLNSK